MSSLRKRLFGPAQLTNSAATKYTVPASTTAILQFLHVFNADTATRTLTMSIGSDAAGTRLYDAFAIAPQSALSVALWLPLTAAEIVQAYADTTNKLVMTLSGVELTLG